MLLLIFAPKVVGAVVLSTEKFLYAGRSTITLFDPRKYPPVPSGGTFIYQGLLTDENGTPLAPASLNALTLSIIDTKTGNIINAVNAEDLLTSSRIVFNSSDGTFRLTTAKEETVLAPPDTKRIRSLILEWRFGNPELIGRHQADFQIVRLAGDS